MIMISTRSSFHQSEYSSRNLIKSRRDVTFAPNQKQMIVYFFKASKWENEQNKNNRDQKEKCNVERFNSL